MDRIFRAKRALDKCSYEMVKILSSDPNGDPRRMCESELRAAWYAILAARESLGRTVSALSPYADYPANPKTDTGNAKDA